MDLIKLKNLISTVTKYDLAEIEIQDGNSKIRILKSLKKEKLNEISENYNKKNYEKSTKDEKKNIVEKNNNKILKSPMVGNFYSAPSPDSKPFVKLGQEVKKGEIICIIESMKILNEVKSDKSGNIQEILVENGESVEYNQPLFIIK